MLLCIARLAYTTRHLRARLALSALSPCWLCARLSIASWTLSKQIDESSVIISIFVMATKKEEAAKNALSAFENFLVLCRKFFGTNPIDNVTSLDKDSEYYKTAQDIAKEFEMDWDNLSIEDSNELTIALLEDYYNRANTNNDFEYIISFKLKEKDKKASE